MCDWRKFVSILYSSFCHSRSTFTTYNTIQFHHISCIKHYSWAYIYMWVESKVKRLSCNHDKMLEEDQSWREIGFSKSHLDISTNWWWTFWKIKSILTMGEVTLQIPVVLPLFKQLMSTYYFPIHIMHRQN